jgi:hypothetical protein
VQELVYVQTVKVPLKFLRLSTLQLQGGLPLPRSHFRKIRPEMLNIPKEDDQPAPTDSRVWLLRPALVENQLEQCQMHLILPLPPVHLSP